VVTAASDTAPRMGCCGAHANAVRGGPVERGAGDATGMALADGATVTELKVQFKVIEIDDQKVAHLDVLYSTSRELTQAGTSIFLKCMRNVAVSKAPAKRLFLTEEYFVSKIVCHETSVSQKSRLDRN
jgi:hypothetical protein